MKAVGIIAEYNPLHNGHIYHLEQTLGFAGNDAVVVAMSGDFVQRGEPAILDKWERAELAINHGADVVIEIPTRFCLGNAAQYAKAGVSLLESIPCVESISFGSEVGDASVLRRVADNLDAKTIELESRISELAKTGYSYPRARAEAYTDLFKDPEGSKILSGSNDILALEYIRACKRLEPVAVPRVGACYNDDIDSEQAFQSASGIRAAMQQGADISEYIPADTAAYLEHSITTDPDAWLNTLKFAVMSMTPEQIDNCPSGDKGLGNRIKSMIQEADSWNEFVEAVKSKRYTHTRISRLFAQIILGISREDQEAEEPAYCRILGLSERGRALIREMREESALPIITNINKQIEELDAAGIKQLELDIHAADVYNLVTGRDQTERSDHRMRPLIVSSK